MMKMLAQRAEQARLEAKNLFAQDRAKEMEVVKEREKIFSAQTDKTSHLRALRLARENEEHVSAAVSAPAAKPKKTNRNDKGAV